MESLNDTVYIHTHLCISLSKKLRATGQCSCAFQDRIAFWTFVYLRNKYNGYWRLECHQCLPYTKASSENRLYGSCRVSGTMTVQDEKHGEQQYLQQDVVQNNLPATWQNQRNTLLMANSPFKRVYSKTINLALESGIEDVIIFCIPVK